MDLAEANTTVSNPPDVSTASFRTGVPVMGSTQSKIEFTNVNFSNCESGEPIQVGLFKITNGMTAIDSGAPIAKFNLGLELTSPAAQSLAVATLMFHIDHTPNLPGAVPDTFSVSFAQPAPVKVQNTLVQFHVNVDPLDFQLAENGPVSGKRHGSERHFVHARAGTRHVRSLGFGFAARSCRISPQPRSICRGFCCGVADRFVRT